ncbi:type IV pilin protein [Acinetobacter sp. P8-3-8]|uniref:type IV pilin protein n=1 Tax=Acinetobacter sp. P8-3-8 TaxID=1029823 RepID=UPI0002485D9D|nr:prepilin-type N-terminal cleavage/methylation domain-containing protein [Acinetobacter sp. P8-3-8]
MKKNNGFTLIELMIVVTIIGLLAAIAVPSYLNYTKNADRKACLLETKSYVNDTYYLIFDQSSETNPRAPAISACESITDASSWNETTTNLIIEAKSKNSAIINIKCDLSKGANCTIIP